MTSYADQRDTIVEVANLLASRDALSHTHSPAATTFAARVIAVEENARLALGAVALGGAKELDTGAISAAVQRKRDFARASGGPTA